jgi:hypothetical protein
MMGLQMNSSLTLKSFALKSFALRSFALKSFNLNSLPRKTFGFGSQNASLRSIKQQGIQPVVSQVYLNGRLIPADRFHVNDGSMASLMQILVFCNESSVAGTNKKPDLDKPLLDFAATRGFHKKLFDKIIPKIAEVRLDDDPGLVSAIVGLNGRYRLVVKDESERLLGRCNWIHFKGRPVPMSVNIGARVRNVCDWMIFHNFKVVMLAFKDMEELPVNINQAFQTDGLTLVGMIGLRDSDSDSPEAKLGVLD